jgi:hypothetical protein
MQEITELTAEQIEFIAGGADNSWAVEIMPGIAIGYVDDGEGPAFAFACDLGRGACWIR